MQERVEELEKELRGVQEMFAFVLNEIGHPVVVGKASLTSGLPNGAQIVINEDINSESFVFSLEVPE